MGLVKEYCVVSVTGGTKVVNCEVAVEIYVWTNNLEILYRPTRLLPYTEVYLKNLLDEKILPNSEVLQWHNFCLHHRKSLNSVIQLMKEGF